MLNRLFPRLPLERILMFASLALGLLHAWMGRYSMNPDGMFAVQHIGGGQTNKDH